jgi:hypothetical protein
MDLILRRAAMTAVGMCVVWPWCHCVVLDGLFSTRERV